VTQITDLHKIAQYTHLKTARTAKYAIQAVIISRKMDLCKENQ